jgi:DNA polymerase III subunit chi
MPKIDFYHCHATPEHITCTLIHKTWQAQQRGVIYVGEAAMVDTLNQALWKTADFLPHGTIKEGNAPRQPFWITDVDENPNGATYQFLLQGRTSTHTAAMERVFMVFNQAEADTARQQWKDYKAAGFSLKYWQQDAAGVWLQKQ